MNDEVVDAASAVARGRRLRYIRDELLRLTRKEFYNRHKDLEITPSCLQNWEDARYKGLKEENAMRLIQAFQRENIVCDKYWLLEGSGNPPIVKTAAKLTEPVMGNPLLVSPTSPLSDDAAITYELRAFHATHPEAVDAIVADEGLAPCYLPGDYVAGIRYMGNAISQVVGKCCIVQATNGQLLLRKIEAGTSPGVYTLKCTNPHAQVTATSIEDIKLFSAAPIIWWRRPS